MFLIILTDFEFILQLHRASRLEKLGDQTAMVSQSVIEVRTHSRPLNCGNDENVE